MTPASKERQSKMRFSQSDTRLVGTGRGQSFELGLISAETFSLPGLYQQDSECRF